MALIRDRFRPDLAMLPIGGHFTMDPVGAALADGAAGRAPRAADPLGHVPDCWRGRRPSSQAAIARPRRHGQVHDWQPGDTIS